MLDYAENVVRRASDVIQAPFGADLGSPPSPIPDVPVSAVFLVLFFAGFVVNLLLFSRNRKNEHHFLLSLALSGMCSTVLDHKRRKPPGDCVASILPKLMLCARS